MESKTGFLEITSIVIQPGVNARQQFDQLGLFELGESMKAHTQLAPILINRVEGKNCLIAGERRLRAASADGQTMIECKIFEGLDELTALRMSLAENRERLELNIIEKARASQKLFEHGIGIEEIAEEEHVGEETIKRRLSLLKLNNNVQQLMVREFNPLPIHQALLLVNLDDSKQIELARRIAPISGQVASESQTREWIDEMAGKPLPFEEDEKERHTPASGKGQKKKAADSALMLARTDWWVEQLKAAEGRENYKANKQGVITNSYDIYLPIPKSSKIAAMIKLGCTKDGWWKYGIDITSGPSNSALGLPCYAEQGTDCGSAAVDSPAAALPRSTPRRNISWSASISSANTASCESVTSLPGYPAPMLYLIPSASAAVSAAVGDVIRYLKSEKEKTSKLSRVSKIEKALECIRQEYSAIEAAKEIISRGVLAEEESAEGMDIGEVLEIASGIIEIQGEMSLLGNILKVRGRLTVMKTEPGESAVETNIGRVVAMDTKHIFVLDKAEASTIRPLFEGKQAASEKTKPGKRGRGRPKKTKNEQHK